MSASAFAPAAPPVCWRCKLSFDWCRCIGTDEWIAEREKAYWKAAHECQCTGPYKLPHMMDAHWPEIAGYRFLNKIRRERGAVAA